MDIFTFLEKRSVNEESGNLNSSDSKSHQNNTKELLTNPFLHSEESAPKFEDDRSFIKTTPIDPNICNSETLEINSTYYKNCLNGLCCLSKKSERFPTYKADFYSCKNEGNEVFYEQVKTADNLFKNYDEFKEDEEHEILFRNCTYFKYFDNESRLEYKIEISNPNLDPISESPIDETIASDYFDFTAENNPKIFEIETRLDDESFASTALDERSSEHTLIEEIDQGNNNLQGNEIGFTFNETNDVPYLYSPEITLRKNHKDLISNSDDNLNNLTKTNAKSGCSNVCAASGIYFLIACLGYYFSSTSSYKIKGFCILSCMLLLITLTSI